MAIPEDIDDINWPKPKVPGKGATIGERFEYSLAEGVRRFLNLFDEPLSELGAWTLKVFMKIFEKSAGSYVKPFLSEYIKNASPDDPMVEVFKKLKTPTGIAGGAMMAGLASGASSAGLMSVLEPYFERARQISYGKFPTKLYDLPTMIGMNWRGELDIGDLRSWSERLGYDKSMLDNLMRTIQPRLPVGDLVSYWLRKGPGETGITDELQKRGWSKAEATRFASLRWRIPPTTDIIRMAVREAFKEDIARKWGLDQDFDPVVAEWGEKVGLSEYWTNKYWRAHWVLPSVSHAYEMLHRGVIDEKELLALMRAQDIMPGWRGPLIEISYRPYTRVDVRRMHKVGVLDRRAVKRAYLDLGFDENKAEHMTEFTIAYNTEEERDASKTDILTAYEEGIIGRKLAYKLLLSIGYRDIYVESYLAKVDYKLSEKERKEEEARKKAELQTERELTKADILSAYENKVFTREETTKALKDIDYPTSVVKILLAKVDYKVSQKLIREEIATTKVLYVNQEIGRPGVHERLGKVALPATQISELLTLWTIERERKIERPTLASLFAFYYNDIIDEEKLKEQIGKHGYSPTYVKWYVNNANKIIHERESAELERQQKEQERIAKSKFKTARMVELAKLSVEMQEWKVYIADLKVAAILITEPDELRMVAEEIIKAKAEIARLQLAKAKVPVVPTV